MTALSAGTLSAVRYLSGESGLSGAAFKIASSLEWARNYAMAHHTHVWIGFYEEDASLSSSSAPRGGKGRVVIGIAASKDGTQVYDSLESLQEPQIVQIRQFVRIENIHLADLGAPGGGVSPLDARPADAYEAGSDGSARLNSDNDEATPYPMTLGKYTFTKVVEFSPGGEATINGNADLRRIGEIGLRPARGSQVDLATRDIAAVQFSGVGGNVAVFRR